MKYITTPNEVYHTPQFRGLRMQLMIDRAIDGLIYCEHCRKVIAYPHDCIAHHKIEITVQNMNDLSITINPDNIALVHHKCHNEIHNRFGNDMRKVYYVYGAPLSGKTSYVQSVKNNGDLVLDIDRIWEAITLDDLYHKPDQLKICAFQVRDCILDMIKTRAGKWRNAYVIETGARRMDRERRCIALGAESIFLECSRAECLERLHTDSSRRLVIDEWTNHIHKWFDEYQPDA